MVVLPGPYVRRGCQTRCPSNRTTSSSDQLGVLASPTAAADVSRNGNRDRRRDICQNSRPVHGKTVHGAAMAALSCCVQPHAGTSSGGEWRRSTLADRADGDLLRIHAASRYE